MWSCIVPLGQSAPYGVALPVLASSRNIVRETGLGLAVAGYGWLAAAFDRVFCVAVSARIRASADVADSHQWRQP